MGKKEVRLWEKWEEKVRDKVWLKMKLHIRKYDTDGGRWERDRRTKGGQMKARKEEAVSIERKKMKGRWTERTEGRTASANVKGKSRRGQEGLWEEKVRQSKKNWRVLQGRAPSLEHSPSLSTPHTQSSASQVIKWISCLVLSERTWPSTLREHVERHSRASLCAICILVSEQGPKQTSAVLGLGGQGCMPRHTGDEQARSHWALAFMDTTCPTSAGGRQWQSQRGVQGVTPLTSDWPPWVPPRKWICYTI